MTGPNFRDLGNNVYVSMHTCKHSPDEWSGCLVGFVHGSDMPRDHNEAVKLRFQEREEDEESPICEGGISWCSECRGATWELKFLDPLHVEPSVACRTHHTHHGFIRDGRWEPAG